MTASARVDVLIDVEAAQLPWESLHHGLEELDRAGFIPHRFTQLPEPMLARIDHDLVGTSGARLWQASAWVIERKPVSAPVFACGVDAAAASVDPQIAQAMPIVGVAGFSGASDSYAALRFGATTADAQPLELGPELAAHRLLLTAGLLFSIRERGFRQALLRDVARGAVPHLAAQFPGAVQVCDREPRKRPRVVVFASGNGSNFQTVIDAAAAGLVDLDICGLVVNRTQPGARGRAERANIPVKEMLWRRTAQTRAEYGIELLAATQSFAPDLIILLGWMHILPPSFVAAFPEILNLHPAYLPLDPAADSVVLPDGTKQPAFRGADAVGDARIARARWIGASVHRVTQDMDRGAILARVPIAFDPDADPHTTAANLHEQEHRILRAVLQKITL